MYVFSGAPVPGAMVLSHVQWCELQSVYLHAFKSKHTGAESPCVGESVEVPYSS